MEGGGRGFHRADRTIFMMFLQLGGAGVESRGGRGLGGGIERGEDHACWGWGS